MAVEPNVRRLVIGAILIISVLIPSINAQVFANIKLKWVYKYNKNLEATYVNAAAAVKAAKAELKASKKDGTFTAAKQDEITNRIASIIQERDTTAAAIRAEMAEEAAKNKTAKASK